MSSTLGQSLFSSFLIMIFLSILSSVSHISNRISFPRGAATYRAAVQHILKYEQLLGVVHVRTNIEERVRDLAAYIVDNQTTVRAAAKQFGISKSTVHKDLTERLPRIDPALYAQARRLLDINKAERHIRGGLATRKKYKGAKPR